MSRVNRLTVAGLAAGLLLAGLQPAAWAGSFRRLRSSSLMRGAFQARQDGFFKAFGILRSGRSHAGVLEDAALARWEFESHAQRMREAFPPIRFRYGR